MNRTPDKDNTGIMDIDNVMLDPSESYGNALKHDSHLRGNGNGNQSMEDIKSGKTKENLSFQEWTAKYHQ